MTKQLLTQHRAINFAFRNLPFGCWGTGFTGVERDLRQVSSAEEPMADGLPRDRSVPPFSASHSTFKGWPSTTHRVLEQQICKR